MIPLIVALLVAPGTVLGLDSVGAGAYRGHLLSTGTIILRDAPDDAAREILVVLRTDCGPYDAETTPDLVSWRWDMRWQTVDAFEVRGPRAVDVIAEDDAGQWRRSCRVLSALSCYAHHAQMWVDAPAVDGGLDDNDSYEDVVASLVAWDNQSAYPCTAARIVRRGAGWVVTTAR